MVGCPADAADAPTDRPVEAPSEWLPPPLMPLPLLSLPPDCAKVLRGVVNDGDIDVWIKFSNTVGVPIAILLPPRPA